MILTQQGYFVCLKLSNLMDVPFGSITMDCTLNQRAAIGRAPAQSRTWPQQCYPDRFP
jgi:hypothetical protein